MDTIYNKVDAKGRVSLPSDYRAIVKETSSEIVCYRSLSAPCIEGCLEDLLDKLAADIETSLDFFSQEQDDLTNLIFGDAKRYPFDSTGRIMLSEKLLKHAGIKDSAVFVGKGRKFQIWNPENWEKKKPASAPKSSKTPIPQKPGGGQVNEPQLQKTFSGDVVRSARGSGPDRR